MCSPIIENQLEKNMKKEMSTGVHAGTVCLGTSRGSIQVGDDTPMPQNHWKRALKHEMDTAILC